MEVSWRRLITILILTLLTLLTVSAKEKSSLGKCKPKTLLTTIKEIYDDLVVINKIKRKEKVEFIEKFVKGKVIEALRNDPLFKLLYKRVYHSGSFYDGLRCGEATEFDLNLVLDIQVLEKILKFDSRQVDPGFVKVQLTSDKLEDALVRKPDWIQLWEQFNKQFVEIDPVNHQRYLKPDRVLRWLESVIAKQQIGSLKYPGIQSMKVVKSGPAMTLKIQLTNGEGEIDVDMVPIFVFKCTHLSSYPEIYNGLQKNGWTNEEFFIIPKKSKKDTKNADRFWRLDFHDIEKKIVAKKGFSKNVIRLLKVARDKNQAIEDLSSYSLKTIVMLMIRDAKPKLDWEEKNLPDLFLEALKYLQERLAEGRIPYYFHHQCDVLWSMKPQKRKEMSTWLGKQIKILDESRTNDKDCRGIWRRFFGLI